jgi:hypothetical protein
VLIVVSALKRFREIGGTRSPWGVTFDRVRELQRPFHGAHSRRGWQMFQNDLLDLAIGLVFVWFILSLVVSVVNEGFVLVFRIRAKHLWLGIGRLVNPRDGRYARRLWETVVSLPLGRRGLDLRPRARPESSDPPLDCKTRSRNLTQGASSPRAGGTSASTDSPLAQRTSQQIATDQRVLLQRVYNALAPYVTDVATERRKSKLTKISGAVFAEAIARLADRVHPADLVAAAKSLHWTKERQDALAEALKEHSPEQVLDPTEITALDLGPNVWSEAKEDLCRVASARDVLDLFKHNAALVQALNKSLEATDAAARSAALRSTVETWFNREMDQLSAMYRRQARKILAILAFFVVLIFPANALGIIADLRSDTALRQAVANQAIASVDSGDLKAITTKYCPPRQGVVGAGADPAGDPLEKARTRFECAGKIIESANSFALVPDFGKIQRLDGQQGWSWADMRLYESDRWGIPGRAITLLALMFGAQFWFDVLRRLVGIRKSSGGEIGSGAG